MQFKIEKHNGRYTVIAMRFGESAAQFATATEVIDRTLAVVGKDDHLIVDAEVLMDFNKELGHGASDATQEERPRR